MRIGNKGGSIYTLSYNAWNEVLEFGTEERVLMVPVRKYNQVIKYQTKGSSTKGFSTKVPE